MRPIKPKNLEMEGIDVSAGVPGVIQTTIRFRKPREAKAEENASKGQ